MSLFLALLIFGSTAHATGAKEILAERYQDGKKLFSVRVIQDAEGCGLNFNLRRKILPAKDCELLFARATLATRDVFLPQPVPEANGDWDVLTMTGKKPIAASASVTRSCTISGECVETAPSQVRDFAEALLNMGRQAPP